MEKLDRDNARAMLAEAGYEHIANDVYFNGKQHVAVNAGDATIVKSGKANEYRYGEVSVDQLMEIL